MVTAVGESQRFNRASDRLGRTITNASQFQSQKNKRTSAYQDTYWSEVKNNQENRSVETIRWIEPIIILTRIKCYPEYLVLSGVLAFSGKEK